MRDLAEKIGHKFSNEQLLREALTHRSFGVPHNERLEFLGDSVLNCAIAHFLYLKFPRLTEGELSRLRANLVNQNSLFEIGQQIGLGERIFLGEGEMKSGGFRRPSIVADALEALFGAIFLDAGFAAAAAVVESLYRERIAASDPVLAKDPKTRLQEYLQGRKFALPRYTVLETSGKAHNQHFKVECVINELGISTRGEGENRKKAEQAAALAAYIEAGA